MPKYLTVSLHGIVLLFNSTGWECIFLFVKLIWIDYSVVLLENPLDAEQACGEVAFLLKVLLKDILGLEKRDFLF